MVSDLRRMFKIGAVLAARRGGLSRRHGDTEGSVRKAGNLVAKLMSAENFIQLPTPLLLRVSVSP
jgi:hypothetical protein